MCIGYRGIATEILDKLCMSQVNPRSGLAMCDELSHSVLHNVGVPGRGGDPSTFAIALETFAAKAFGDMGANAQLRFIQDRFVAGHEN